MEGEEVVHCSVKFWRDRWENNNIAFHKDEVNPYLEKYFERLTCNRSNIRVFVPLSGKSADVKWLADRGCEVVGVECSQKAIETFFKEQSLEYTTSTLAQGTIYKCLSSPIIIYCCDLFDFGSMQPGLFNTVWDRGSLVAINPADQERYSRLLKSLLDSDFLYLIETIEYLEQEDWDIAGPPHHVPTSKVESLFGDKCYCEKIESDNEEVGKKFSSSAFLMSPKL